MNDLDLKSFHHDANILNIINSLSYFAIGKHIENHVLHRPSI